MKRTLPWLAILTIACGTTVVAQQQQEQPQQQDQQKMIKVADLKTPEQVTEFERNVELVRAQRAAAVQLNDEITKEKDPKKKADEQKHLDDLLRTLNKNNAAMVKAYGFSLDRNYTLSINSASVYLHVTNEEAAKIQQQEDARKKDEPAK